MKVVVTGGTGFVGSHAVEALCRAGHEVRLFARSREKVDRVLEMRGVEVHEVVLGDMTDPAACRKALVGCDAVVHTAASVEIGTAREVFSSNLDGIHNVVGAAVELELDPIVYVSSIATMFPPRGSVVTLDDPVVNLRSDYGRSKAEGELYVRDLQQRGAPIVSVYPSGVYGPDDPGPGPGLKGLRDRVRYTWIMTTGGTACVDVRDLAQILAAVLESGRGPRRYMAGGHFLSWAQEADVCERILGRRVRRISLPPWALRLIGRIIDGIKWVYPAFDYPLTYEAAQFVTQMVPCDSRRTIEELGIEFRPVEETLGDAIDWMVKVGELAPAQGRSLLGPA